MKSFSFFLVVTLSILCKYANCIEEITACFKSLNGVCIKTDFPCPFIGGLDKIGYQVKHFDPTLYPLCPQGRLCCAPPENKDRLKYTLNLPQCGISYYARSPIHHGSEVDNQEHPWHASIYIDHEYMCGGSFINSKWILTAAHCLLSNKSIDYLVSSSTTRYVESKNLLADRNYKVKKLIIHAGYNKTTNENDIALLLLEESVPFDHYTNVVCLPNDKEKFDNMVCIASGFGLTESRTPSKKLLQVALPIQPIQKCKDSFKDTVVDETKICAGYDAGWYGVCHGDSGGPLVCRKKDAKGIERYILGGIVSYGNSMCSLPYTYAVFTNVSNYISWINEIMALHQ